LTFGSHTWTHPNLTRLDATQLAHELTAPATWLQQFEMRTIPVISYPYGRADESVWHAAEATGYHAGLMIDGGWATVAVSSRYAIPRLNIPAGVSNAGFILRTSGLIAA
jgi:peptidoglycan/xylan/chitin deacetylase (PgdA/CDA1 family)